MKTWLAKFRISNALDRGKPLPASLRRRISGSDELGRFAAGCAELDRALKASAPEPGAPPALHNSIMQAVRAARRPPAADTARPRPGPAGLRWAPAAGLGLGLALVMAAALWLRPQAGPPKPAVSMAQALQAPGAALDLGSRMAHAVPSGVVAPLSEELERLNRDLDQTAQFVLANLP